MNQSNHNLSLISFDETLPRWPLLINLHTQRVKPSVAVIDKLVQPTAMLPPQWSVPFRIWLCFRKSWLFVRRWHYAVHWLSEIYQWLRFLNLFDKDATTSPHKSNEVELINIVF